MARIPSSLLAFRSSTIFITFCIAFAVFTDQFLYAAIVPVLPFALKGQVPEDKTQFWTAVLLAMFGVGCFLSSVPWGIYTDRSSSRRLPFLIGLLVLLASTVLLWIAPLTHKASIPVQVLARLIQGFASTVVWTTGLAVLVDTVGQAHIGEYSGYIGIALSAGSLIAPLLGGVVFANCGYNAVFGLIVGVIALDILLRLFMKENPRKFAPSTSALLTSDLESAETTLTEEKPPSLDVVDLDAISTTAPSTTDQASTTSTKRHLPAMLRLLFSSRFLAALWAIFVLASVYSGFETILPITVNELFSWNSTGAGLIFLPMSVPALLGPCMGKLTDRLGGRYFAAAAFLLLCPCLTLLRLVTHNSMPQKVLLCSLLVLIGTCLATILEPMFSEITTRAEELETEDVVAGIDNKGRGYYAQAYAHFNMAWAIGNTVGPLFAGFVVEYAGWKTATWTLGLLSGVSAIPVLLLCGGWILKEK